MDNQKQKKFKGPAEDAGGELKFKKIVVPKLDPALMAAKPKYEVQWCNCIMCHYKCGGGNHCGACHPRVDPNW